jgi:hypothetical protein
MRAAVLRRAAARLQLYVVVVVCLFVLVLGLCLVDDVCME